MAKLDQIMQTEMTREQFLKTVGCGVVVLFGFGNALKLVGKHDLFHTTATAAAPIARGYGGIALKQN